MNLQLVEAIEQITKTLSLEEKKLLVEKLNKSLLTESKQPDRENIITPTEPSSPKLEQGWDAFLTLGQIAVSGKLDNAAIEHDKYLYGVQNEANTH